jgi:hypothetical protein
MVREFLFCSLLLWQIGLIIYILLNRFYGKEQKQNTKILSTPSPVEVELPKRKKEISHVDIEVKKQINTQKPTTSTVKSDEVIKGKVKTQKNKLKKLRGL